MMGCYTMDIQYTTICGSQELGEGLVTMFDRPPRYRSYLLTLWEERSRDPAAPAVWRFSLEDPRTGQRHGFATLEALVAALEREMAGHWTGEEGVIGES